MAPGDESKMRDLFLELATLKEEKRRGWQLRGISNPESVADHSWLVAMIVLSLDFPPEKKLRLLELALAHDVAEIVTGDLTPADKVSREDKNTREALAMQYFTCRAPGAFTTMLRDRLAEYNNAAERTDEARIVHLADKIEAAVQAQRYLMTSPRDESGAEHGLGDFKVDIEGLDLDIAGGSGLRALRDDLVRRWGAPRWELTYVFAIGGPGSGKGTMCSYLVKGDPRVESISLGEQLRLEAADDTSDFQEFIRKSFELQVVVPATLAVQIIKKKIAQAKKAGKSVFIIDGFPRSVKQLKAFEAEIDGSYSTIYLKCPVSVLADRLASRAKSSGRDDDQDAQARQRRAEEHEKSTNEILKELQRNTVHEIDACQKPDEVASRAAECLKLESKW
ncbi:hypothetical protein Micbo1qcDRAFT_143402 [Microdochium bolleyi]|uniref:5'-deoxynucleotidase n=1 Tax=Microdochium bolleyi TaxID=196109 RepID=A0A136JDF6_9PEZI|nr:hypothetical protein Micbo1qcDRAFT_143402 [Microdochium bolleyi]